jgi:hypothetical protein
VGCRTALTAIYDNANRILSPLARGDRGFNPNSEVEGSLIPDSFVFLQDSSLRFRSVQNDKQVVVILSDVVVILSDSEESRINFGIRV